MKNLFKKHLIVGLLSLTYSFANAYDVDTHFYGTYSMARFAGIKHEIAAQIATGAQWMDESYISDPVSTIVAIQFGVKKRRLLHFPGSRLEGGELEQDFLSGIFSFGAENRMAKFTETRADDDFATEMFTEGLMEGNLMKASVGLHTLEDSFAHAGTFAEAGHAEFWHHPDRPYVNKESVEKYFVMTRSVLKAMVAIRKLLPEDKIDKTIQFSATPNYRLEGDALASMYANEGNRYPNLRIIRNTVSHNILKDPSFVRKVAKFCFDRAYAYRYVENGYNSFVTGFKEDETSVDAISRISLALYDANLLNVDQILISTGRLPKSDPEFTKYLHSKGGRTDFIKQVVVGLFAGTVPRELDVYHRVEKEEDGDIWKLELAMREENMKRLIKTLYGNDVAFVPNNTPTLEGFKLELAGRSPANPRGPHDKEGISYVTYTPEQKTKFDHMIFKFIFPSLSKSIGDKFTAYIQAIAPSEKDFKSQLQNLFSSAISSFGKSFSILGNAQDDLMNTRMRANPLNTYYKFPALFEEKMNAKNPVFNKFDLSNL